MNMLTTVMHALGAY